MCEILISFFAVIGIVFFFGELFDFLNYRKKRFPLEMVLDLRETTEDSLLEILQLFCSLRRNSKGISFTQQITIQFLQEDLPKNQWFLDSMEKIGVQIHLIPGEKDPSSFQNTPSRESVATVSKSESECSD